MQFTPETFSVIAEKPLYLYQKDTLYFSETGNIDDLSKAIWHGELVDASVSPNSKNILLFTPTGNHLINSQGDLLRIFEPNEIQCNQKDTKLDIGYRTGDIQWSSNSQFLFQKKVSHKNRKWGYAGLMRYNLGQNVEDELITSFKCYEYFFTITEDTILFITATKLGDLQTESYDLVNKSRSILPDTSSYFDSIYNVSQVRYFTSGKEFLHIQAFTNIARSIARDCFFITFDSYFGAYSAEESGLKAHGLFYCKDDSCWQPIVVYDGYDSYWGHTTLNLSGSYFLPGDRYYMFHARTEQYQGNLLIDLKDFRYRRVREDLEIFFSVTSEDTPNIIVKAGVIKVNDVFGKMDWVGKYSPTIKPSDAFFP